jgi:hypothetical protein
VLAEHPKLRLNFGHTGGLTGTGFEDGARMVGYMRAPGTVGPRHAYGDLSYAAATAENHDNLRDLLVGIFSDPSPQGGSAAGDRLMFGTDWLMLLQEASVDDYHSVFQGVLADVDAKLQPATEVSDRFFATNALDWAGLNLGGAGRDRLSAFYKANGVDVANNPPNWMRKSQP